jgi:hypothetical protein
MTEEESLKFVSLRNRKPSNPLEKVAESTDSVKGIKSEREEVVWGKTPDGTGTSLYSTCYRSNLTSKYSEYQLPMMF